MRDGLMKLTMNWRDDEICIQDSIDKKNTYYEGKYVYKSLNKTISQNIVKLWTLSIRIAMKNKTKEESKWKECVSF